MLFQFLALLPLASVALAAPSSGQDMPAAPPADQYDATWDPSQGQGYDQSWQQAAGDMTIVHATTITVSPDIPQPASAYVKQTAAGSHQTPQYGSGSWGGATDMNSCMEMCQAQYGGGGGGGAMGGGDKGMMTGGEQPSGTTPPAGPATHTIIVAPSQGVLRFVPFAINAQPGDKLHYIWGAGPHTVTKSDGQNVCNKSTTASAFDSGKLNATATFEQTVTGNASAPQFYYCSVATHCSKGGMFGLINPPMTNVSNDLTDLASQSMPPIAKSTAGSGGGSKCVGDSMECWIDRWKGSGSAASQMYEGVKSKCASAPAAWAWGNKWDMSGWDTTVVTKEIIIENVMYNRYMFAENPAMLDKTKPFPANWTTPPELNSFVVDKGNSSAADLGYNTTVAGSSASESAASSDSSPSGTISAEGAQGTGGAARSAVSAGAWIGAIGVAFACLL